MLLIIKYLATAAIIVLISEVTKRSDRLGGLLAALPIMTILILIWMQLEQQPLEKISNHAWYTLWYVLPTLPMFAMFPYLLSTFGFWPSLALSLGLTCVCTLLFAMLLERYGIHLIA